ncbi:MAG: peptide chain release factor N(5)-glutamine methyltransferase [Candidatus Syntrophonatronum acetioxidans]|uniref:Release factor glutamine methyltransferase n=1 Tax=Candidatus Syntrophonatronum acetioxidans TaxID=1795816 RepID=A0A424YFV7_9FIRM|nr:MAG: peptide chain release factor N(5)-glutamine methyltransferase [Candidatus Syntrophonatronum acetioxidans]
MNKTIKEALQGASLTLKKAGISHYNYESALLLAFCLGKDLVHIYTYPEKHLTPSQEEKYKKLVEKRASRVPYHYLVGEREFMGLSFRVNPWVLIPRPDTEILAQEALRWAREREEKPLYLLDLGTGSGILAITLAFHLPHCQCWATDLSREALQVAAENAARHGVEGRITFLQGDLWEALEGERELQGQKFSLILSNPPYVPRDQLKELPREIRDHEPLEALEGGPQGLDFYPRIISRAHRFLASPGLLLLEVGEGQGKKVREMSCQAGIFKDIYILKDYQGLERVVASLRA